MYAFNYHRPASLAEVQRTLASCAEPQLLAGGMTLLPTLKLRLAQPSDLIDLAALSELRGLRREGARLIIGAMTTHCEVASCELVRNTLPALASLAGHIGDPQVRHRGTLGGSLANNDPAADYPAAVLGLNATVQTTERSLPADEFFQGLFETALNEQELITQVSFPLPEKAAYAKFPNPASRYALVGVWVARFSDGVRVAVTGAGSEGVFRVPAMEQALAKEFSPAAIAALKVAPEELNADIHASPDYRAHLITVMAKRAVAAAI
jgi:carbon-monoxide dehydrogenase medium subunit